MVVKEVPEAFNLVWMDLEMTGLDPKEDTILEIATIITDKELNIIAQGPELAIHHEKKVLSAMGGWCTKHHGDSGLSRRVLESNVSMQQAANETLAFMKEYAVEGKSPLCGNSIHQDRRFLRRYMPDVDAFLHYRNIDVSTLKELQRRWYPELRLPKKKVAHLALSDIKDSIAELKIYREKFFLNKADVK
ncbi:MAG: oligoribonuclease [Mariprofundaceae bacterium]|nr:oligoribonuclease [Mariprofundaceae bacterium]